MKNAQQTRFSQKRLIARVNTALIGGTCGALLLLGVASADEGYTTWYGPGFHGNRMANGQVFDQNDPTTTASNMFPMGTWLKVTNPRNGRTVTVQVRDRGRFTHALDLSKAAFFALNPPNDWGFNVEFTPVSGPSGEVVEAPAAPPAPPSARAVAPKPTKVDAPRPEPSSRGTRPSESGRSYIVQKGDTLWGIAESKGVTAAGIADLNTLADAGLIRVGQTLKIPTATGTIKSKRSYVVQSGDTMNGIASILGVARADLQAENGITNPDLIQLGHTLAVPD